MRFIKKNKKIKEIKEEDDVDNEEQLNNMLNKLTTNIKTGSGLKMMSNKAIIKKFKI